MNNFFNINAKNSESGYNRGYYIEYIFIMQSKQVFHLKNNCLKRLFVYQNSLNGP